MGLAVGDGPGGVAVGVSEGVGVMVGVGVRVGKVGTAVGVLVDLGVRLGWIVAVACGVSGVHVGCKEVAVAVGTVGRSATLATVGSIVGVANASVILVLTLLLSWLKLARCLGETMSSTTMITAIAAKMSNAAVNTFKQPLKQPLLEFFWLKIGFFFVG